jgi:hypothetical protein
MTISELADDIRHHFPSLEIHRTATKFEDNRNYRVSSAKARRDLNFNPGLTVSVGIREIHTLLDEGRLRDVANPRYANDRFLLQQAPGFEQMKARYLE